LERRTQTGSAEATQIFSAVLARDSSYGDAWTALAQTYVRADIRGFVIPGVPSDSIIDAAVRAVDRALALDSNSAAAWRVRGTLSERIDPTDDAAALQSIRHAIALDSTQPESFVLLGMYLTETGDPDGRHCGGASLPGPESDQYPVPRLPWDFLLLAPPVRQRGVFGDSAVSVDPGYYPGRTSIAATELSRGNIRKSVAAFDAAVRLSSGVETVNAMAGSALAVDRAGQAAKARGAAGAGRFTLEILPTLKVTRSLTSPRATIGLGDTRKALRLLTDYQPRADLHFQLHLRCDPLLDPWRRILPSNRCFLKRCLVRLMGARSLHIEDCRWQIGHRKSGHSWG
jgi:hypothetical protein